MKFTTIYWVLITSFYFPYYNMYLQEQDTQNQVISELLSVICYWLTTAIAKKLTFEPLMVRSILQTQNIHSDLLHVTEI